MKLKLLVVTVLWSLTIVILGMGCGGDSPTQTPVPPPVVPPANSPTITSISPSSGSITGGTVVSIVGANFDNQTSVTFGGAAGTNFSLAAGATQQTITITTPVGAPGLADVKVTNFNGLGATQTGGFTFQAPAPTVSQVNPNQGSIAGGATITITGSGFFCTPLAAQNPTVTIGASSATVTACTTTSLTATTPTGSLGTVNAVVHNNVTNNTNPSATVANAFTYVAGATISSISRDVGSSAGGTQLSINGSGFSAGLVIVKFGNLTQISTVSSDSKIDVTTILHPLPPAATDCKTSGMPTISVSSGCVVDVSVTVNGIPALGTDPLHPLLFDFEPAPTAAGSSPGVYATFDFENSTQGPFTSDTPGNLSFSTVTSHSGKTSNIALKTSVTTGFGGNAARIQYHYGIDQVNGPNASLPSAVPVNPPVSESTGLYQRWYMMIPDHATLDNTVNTTTCISTFALSVSTCGQIKLHLARYPTQTASTAAWLHMGTGADFGTFAANPSTGINVTTKEIRAFRDFLVNFVAATATPVNLTSTPGTKTGIQLKVAADNVVEWHEIQTWYRRTGGVGYVKLWIDGKLMMDSADPLFGSDDPTQKLTFEAGIAFTQYATGPLTVYLDDVAVGNGYFEAAP